MTTPQTRTHLPGSAFPLGSTLDEGGANFAIFSEKATGVELLLYDHEFSPHPKETVRLVEASGHIWHAYIPGIAPGQLYAYSVSGPYDPARGFRFNPNKALVDPYSKAFSGRLEWKDAVFGYDPIDPSKDLSFSTSRSDEFVPKSVVVDTGYNWGNDSLPRTPWNETVIYELHVKGFTKLNQEVEESKRGTFSGLSSPPVVAYLKDLGITALELLPVHQGIDNKFLVDAGLKNYWEYNTLGYFAPEASYSSKGSLGGQVSDFKDMVRVLHEARIEVILDVVYNHTAEGDCLGPTLSFRGIDNAAYYRLQADNPRLYVDFTGTGNTMNARNPHVIQMIMDSLRYWILEMHVDGFRFDLASTLARELWEVDRLATFFEVIHQDPVISRVKLIAEPWDLGSGGYQVGKFPPSWAEWNASYRDSIRKFWRGDVVPTSEIGLRLTGSSDLFSHDRRTPQASVNYITCHDGFTLADLSSYNVKHNESNMEGNRDGSDENHSWNFGVEGPTNDPRINSARSKQARNLLATLLFSQGTPMILAGDEIGRTQRGNNNAYCHDDEVSWVSWDLDDEKKSLLEFTKKLINFRKKHQILRRRKHFQGRSLPSPTSGISWFHSDGSSMSEEQWHSFNKSFGFVLHGDKISEVDLKGRKIVDDTFLVFVNSDDEGLSCVISSLSCRWFVSVDTRSSKSNQTTFVPGGSLFLEPKSLVVLELGS